MIKNSIEINSSNTLRLFINSRSVMDVGELDGDYENTFNIGTMTKIVCDREIILKLYNFLKFQKKNLKIIVDNPEKISEDFSDDFLELYGIPKECKNKDIFTVITIKDFIESVDSALGSERKLSSEDILKEYAAFGKNYFLKLKLFAAQAGADFLIKDIDEFYTVLFSELGD